MVSGSPLQKREYDTLEYMPGRRSKLVYQAFMHVLKAYFFQTCTLENKETTLKGTLSSV
jgi:hypothetical protein